MGFSQKFKISCSSCLWCINTYASPKIETNDSPGQNRYTVNTLATIAFREIGKGHEAVKSFIDAPHARSQLPEFGVREEHPFASVGIDFAGPLYVKLKSRSSRKVYLALFTCTRHYPQHTSQAKIFRKRPG